MTRSEQKAQEKAILDDYCDLARLSGKIERGPEPPDYILKNETGVIGIEIIEFHQRFSSPGNVSRRMVEAEWEHLLRSVEEFRQEHRELDNLNVYLEFNKLRVPPRHDHRAFIENVTAEINAARDRIGSEDLQIAVRSESPLSSYLSAIVVSAVEAVLEWDWNQNYGWVGSSEGELLSFLQNKLEKYNPRQDLDTSHLVIAGWAGRVSGILAPLSAAQFNEFHQLNSALETGPFDVVVVLCLKNLMWTRITGWQELPRRGRRSGGRPLR